MSLTVHWRGRRWQVATWCKSPRWQRQHSHSSRLTILAVPPLWFSYLWVASGRQSFLLRLHRHPIRYRGVLKVGKVVR